MSRSNDYINTEDKILKYLEEIKGLPYTSEIFLVGSRGKETHKEHSDWDIWVTVKFPVKNFNLKYGKPDGYNIDFICSTENPEKDYKPL